MAYQKAFCSLNAFNQLFINNSNEILEKILTDFCDIYMDVNEDEIDVLKIENPIFKSFMKRDIGTVLPAKNDFQQINLYKTRVLKANFGKRSLIHRGRKRECVYA